MRRIYVRTFNAGSISFAVPLIIFVNFWVYILWKLFGGDGEESNFMTRNFLVSYEALADGRAWTLLTSVFSHNLFFHFLINMIVLKSFGSIVERLLGFRKFIRFYIVAGMAGSFGHAMASQYLLHDPTQAALGASGAVAGVILFFSLVFPKEKLLFFFVIPVPAFVGALIFIGLDIWGLVSQVGGHGLPIGHGAHLGGALIGILYGAKYLFRKNSGGGGDLRPPGGPNPHRSPHSQTEVIDADYNRIQ